MNLCATPWSCFDEWKFVFDGLFSDDPKLMRDSILIGECWLLRGSCPPPVETTIYLMKIKHANLLTSQGSVENDQNASVDNELLRLSLSSILIRFVNETVDPHQQGQYALPITHLAEKIGLPRILVDLRHDATHSHLPSYNYLLMGMDSRRII